MYMYYVLTILTLSPVIAQTLTHAFRYPDHVSTSFAPPDRSAPNFT